MKLASPDGHVTVELTCLNGREQLVIRTYGFYDSSATTMDALDRQLTAHGIVLADLREI